MTTTTIEPAVEGDAAYTIIWARRTARFTVEFRRHKSLFDPADDLSGKRRRAALRAIRRGDEDWFDLEVAVLSGGVELGTAWCSGCWYALPFKTADTGYARDLLHDAVTEARGAVWALCGAPLRLAV
jgi:hypothetical protein